MRPRSLHAPSEPTLTSFHIPPLPPVTNLAPAREDHRDHHRKKYLKTHWRAPVEVSKQDKVSFDADQWRLDVDDEELKRVLYADLDASDIQIVALDEIIERNLDDADLSTFVVTKIEHIVESRGPAKWRDALIMAAARMLFRNPAERTRLSNALLTLVHDIHNAPRAAESRPLYAAIRRFAQLRPQAHVEELTYFIQEGQPAPLRAATLLAIADAFAGIPPVPSEISNIKPLQDRVSAIVHCYFSNNSPATKEEETTALEAIYAAALLVCPNIHDLVRLAKQSRRPWNLEWVVRDLSRACAAWHNGPQHELTAISLHSLEKTLALLRQPPTD